LFFRRARGGRAPVRRWAVDHLASRRLRGNVLCARRGHARACRPSVSSTSDVPRPALCAFLRTCKAKLRLHHFQAVPPFRITSTSCASTRPTVSTSPTARTYTPARVSPSRQLKRLPASNTPPCCRARTRRGRPFTNKSRASSESLFWPMRRRRGLVRA
jgi:hypothetical protein